MIPLPEDDPDEPLPFTAGFAVLLGIGAGYLHLVLFIGPVLVQWARPDSLMSPARIGIAAILAYGAVFALGTQRVRQAPAQALGFVSAPRIGWLAAALLLPAILLISEIDNVTKAFFPVPEDARPDSMPPLVGMRLAEWGVVLVAVLPVVEEVFFRGLIQPRLVEAWGRMQGVVSAALMAGFALAFGMFNPYMFPIVVGRSLVLGMLRESTGSLVPGLLLNISFGGIALLSMVGAFGIPGFDDSETAAHTPLVWLLPAAAATGLGLGLCRALVRARDSLLEDSSVD